MTKPKYEAKNTHKVPKSQWKKWTIVGKHVFNMTFSTMMSNPNHYKHPEAPVVTEEHYKTTCWNAAWIAADYCSRGERHYLDLVIKELKS